MNWLVDDQHLGMLLRTGRRPSGTRRTDRVFTTGFGTSGSAKPRW